MGIKEVNGKAKKMIANFVEQLGLDGDYYVQVNCKSPVAFGKMIKGQVGEYMTPETRRLNGFLKGYKLEPDTEKRIRDRGLILINEKYKNKEDSDVYITLIHETIHANRNMMIKDAYRDENYSPYITNDGKIEQNVDKFNTRYGDFSQEILKGNIDDSRDTIRKYEELGSDKTEELIDLEMETAEKIEQQKAIDETLVDMIAKISYNLYEAKENGETQDIWAEIQKIKDGDPYADKRAMAEIMLRHRDLQLFNWMLNPLEYSNGDINYDYFANYAKADGDLVAKIYVDNGLSEKGKIIDELNEKTEVEQQPIELGGTSKSKIKETDEEITR